MATQGIGVLKPGVAESEVVLISHALALDSRQKQVACGRANRLRRPEELVLPEEKR